MNLASMKTLLELYIDDLADTTTAVDLFNIAKDRMATEVNATFADIVANGDLSDSFAFDSKYHELPVFYAAAMYKSADSSISEKNSYMNQFEAGLIKFSQKYETPIQYKDGPTIQQFTAVQDQMDFVVTKNDFNFKYTEMQVYLNGLAFYDYEVDTAAPNTVTIPSGTNAGDLVTITWEMNDIYNSPPAFYPSGW